MRPQPAMNIAVRAARQGGRVLLRLLNRLDQISVVEKERNDYVSEADHAADQAIVQEIRKAYPDHAILTEESGISGSGEFRWIIDPLDGTHNYIQGFPHFCISLALEKNGVLEHGVIYDPLREEMFSASRGYGAFINNHRLRVGDRRSLSGAMLATGFPFRDKSRMPDFIRGFADIFQHCSDIRRTGSAALDLAYVAAGRLDGFWESHLKPWDLAAGILLVREAGGTCVDFDGGESSAQRDDIIAANVKLASALQQRINACRAGVDQDVRSGSHRPM